MPILKTSPLDALRPLTPVSDEVEQSLSASAMAEDGGWRLRVSKKYEAQEEALAQL
jgi:hypothetical protein